MMFQIPQPPQGLALILYNHIFPHCSKVLIILFVLIVKSYFCGERSEKGCSVFALVPALTSVHVQTLNEVRRIKLRFILRRAFIILNVITIIYLLTCPEP